MLAHVEGLAYNWFIGWGNKVPSDSHKETPCWGLNCQAVLFNKTSNQGFMPLLPSLIAGQQQHKAYLF